MPKRKYPLAMLRPVVEASLSYAEVLRRLGLKQTGGSQANIKRLVQQYGISTDHFLGQLRNSGDRHRGGPVKATADEILVLRDPLTHPEKPYRLRRAIIEIGIPYRCAVCGLEAVWNDQPLMLTIDHINGCRNDNRRENIRFLCPNCHSQTPTFGRNEGMTDLTTCKRWSSQYRQKQKLANKQE